MMNLHDTDRINTRGPLYTISSFLSVKERDGVFVLSLCTYTTHYPRRLDDIPERIPIIQTKKLYSMRGHVRKSCDRAI